MPGTDTTPANFGNMSQTEAAFADFLGGYLKRGYGSFATGDPARNWYLLTGSGYFADTWQIKPTLNICYGLRYDYNTPWYDPTHTISTWSPAFPTSTTPPSLEFPGRVRQPHQFALSLGRAHVRTPHRLCLDTEAWREDGDSWRLGRLL